MMYHLKHKAGGRMKSFKISSAQNLKYLRWLIWFGLCISPVYLYIAYDTYLHEDFSWSFFINLFLALMWIGIGISYYFGYGYQTGDIIISDKSIRYENKTEQTDVAWTDLSEVKMTNNALFLNLQDNSQKELNIAYLEYKELQAAKKKVHQFCDAKNVSFSSQY